jgi:hypothetical protein
MDLQLRSRSSQTTFVSLVISVPIKHYAKHVTGHFVTFPFLYSPCGPWPLFQFNNPTQSVDFLRRGISLSQGRYLHKTTQTQNKRTQTSICWVGFEPRIPVFERAKMVHALDRMATMIGIFRHAEFKFVWIKNRETHPWSWKVCLNDERRTSAFCFLCHNTYIENTDDDKMMTPRTFPIEEQVLLHLRFCRNQCNISQVLWTLKHRACRDSWST